MSDFQSKSALLVRSVYGSAETLDGAPSSHWRLDPEAERQTAEEGCKGARGKDEGDKGNGRGCGESLF